MPVRTRRPGAKKTPRQEKQIIGSRVKIPLDDSLGKETPTRETPYGQTIRFETRWHC